MRRSRLSVGLTAAFAAMTAALAIAALFSNLAILAPAILFGTVTYLLWMHANGRLAARIYRRVERRAATNGGPSTRRDHGRSNRQSRYRRRAERVRGGDARRERTRRTNGGPRSRPNGTSIAREEAREVLGVDPNADQDRIKEAYRDRVKEVHPDAEGGDREAFRRVRDAYETLRE